MASIRAGFPVVADHAAAAPPYDVLTDAFSASAGDELVAFAIGSGLPTVTSRNSADTGPGTLKWILRCVARPDYRNTTYGTNGELQVAIYTAVVPAGGVTERALYPTTTVANEGGGTVSGSKPARLIVVAADDTNGIGAISWRGSVAAGANSNDITTGAAATHTIKPFGASSLLLTAGIIRDGATPTAASGCTEVVAPGTNRMPLYSRTGGAAGAAIALGSSQTDAAVWALALVEYLPTATPAPTKRLLVIGDSGTECVLSSMPHGVEAQDDLAPYYALYNHGIWWTHLAQAEARWEAVKADLPPMDYAVLQIGGNDIQDSGFTWTTTFQNLYLSIMDDLELAGTVIIANTGIGPGAGAGLPQAYYDYRDWVTANVPAGSHLYSTQPIADPGTNYTTLLAAYQAADGQHINGAGNAIWGSEYAAWITSQTPHVYARPSSDNTDGPWTPSTGTDLYTCIDETPASDTDFITTNGDGTANVILSDPGAVDAGVRTLRFRAQGAPHKKLIVRLLEGTTTIQTVTVDPLPAAFALTEQAVAGPIGNYGNLRAEFECAAATTPPTPNAAYGAAGTGANGTTSVAVPYPSGITAGQMLVMAFSSGSTGNSVPATPSGWTAPANNSFASTDGTWGLDTGPRRMTVFTRVADGSESGNVTVTIAGDTNNSCRGTIHRFTKSQSSYTWDVVCHGGADSTSGTGFSVTAGAAISFAPGDHLLIAVSQRVDSATQSAQSITASGITFGTRTNRATTAVTTGHDHRHVVDTVPVSSGSASVAPVWAYTASAACSGGCVFVRLREIPPTADVAQVSFFEFEVPQGSGASSVSADLDARWALLNTAQADADLRWGQLNAAQSDLDARWSILVGVQSDADLRWQMAGSVSADLDARWSLLNAAASDADLRWSLLNAAQSDLDARWSILAGVQSDADLRWQMAGSVASDLDARWSLLNTAQADADLRWSLLNAAQADVDVRWSALAAAQADADLRWQMAGSVSADLDARWALLNAAQADADLRWGLLNAAQSDLDARWSILAGVQSDADLRWQVLAALSAVQADLEMQWQAAGSVNADLDARWALLNAAQAELDARWGLLTSAQADADLRWSALAAIEADADLRWSIGQVVVLARPHGTQHQNTRPAAHSSSRPRALANGRRPH